MKLLLYPNPSLKIYCQEVKHFNEQLHSNLDKMIPIMQENNGMGLSAPQVGLDERFFIMKDLKGKIWEFINPKVIYEYGSQYKDEGCLSFPGVVVQVRRPEQVSVQAYDRFGQMFHVGAIDKEAICISHEIQHLNGNNFLEGLARPQRRDAIKRIKR